jgi:hypothetical protein
MQNKVVAAVRSSGLRKRNSSVDGENCGYPPAAGSRRIGITS